MGKIKKLYQDNTVGNGSGEENEVYPITAAKAVYTTDNIDVETVLGQLNTLTEKLCYGYRFMGVATQSTIPNTSVGNVFYIAPAGTYPNFNAVTVPTGYIGFFIYDTQWSYPTIAVGSSSPGPGPSPGGGTITSARMEYSGPWNNVVTGYGYLDQSDNSVLVISQTLPADREIPFTERIVHNDGSLSAVKNIVIGYPTVGSEDPNTLYISLD